MPVHRCHFDALEATIATLEADGERVVSVAHSGDSLAVITSSDATPRRTAPQGKERR